MQLFRKNSLHRHNTLYVKMLANSRGIGKFQKGSLGGVLRNNYSPIH